MALKSSTPYNRIYNFSAGPGTMPVEVLERAREEMLNWNGSGMSVMEMSHRGKAFQSICDQTEADLRDLMGIPGNYKVLFLQGGASLQFTMVPMNVLPAGRSADYVVTGSWGEKAIEAARLAGTANLAYSAKETNYDRVPDLATVAWSSDAAYRHITLNETIQGVDYLHDPQTPAEWVCDMSSDILSRPIDVSKYALIYAGAQKNLGPAGLTLVIIRDDLLERIPSGLPPMLDYRVQADNGSMYNTPPCWSIYMCGLVFQHWKRTGGLQAVTERNERKAKVLYDAIDGSDGFYVGHAQTDCRSRMNIAFRLSDDSLTDTFVKEAAAEGMTDLKGHRSVGGCRASIYNAFPEEGVRALAEFMREFKRKNG